MTLILHQLRRYGEISIFLFRVIPPDNGPEESPPGGKPPESADSRPATDNLSDFRHGHPPEALDFSVGDYFAPVRGYGIDDLSLDSRATLTRRQTRSA